MEKFIRIMVILATGICLSATVFAQEDYYRVYQFETPYKGHLELTHWISFVGKSNGADYERYDKTYTRDKLLATSLEAEYGITDHFVMAYYADFDDPQNG